MTKDHYSKEILRKGGIYQITNMVNGKVYVGSAVNFRTRFNGHIRDLRGNKHHSKYLQRAFNKYGSNSFEWEILKVIEKSENVTTKQYGKLLCKYEQFFIDTLDSYNNGYNAYPTAKNGSVGQIITEEHRINHRKGIIESLGHKCLIYTLNGDFVQIFKTKRDAAKFCGVKNNACWISQINSSGKCRNYMIKPYEDGFPLKIEPYKKNKDKIGKSQSENHKKNIGAANSISVVMLNEKDEVVQEFASCAEIRRNGVSIYKSLGKNIFMLSNKYGKVKFLYKSDYEKLIQENKAA